MVSLLTERSPEQRGQGDHADVRSADAVEDTSATAWITGRGLRRGSRPDGRCPQNSPSTLSTTTITTIAPMMYRIEYIGYLFPQPPQRPLWTLLWGAALVARRCTTAGRWVAAGTPRAGSASLESYGPRFSIRPGRELVMSVSSRRHRSEAMIAPSDLSPYRARRRGQRRPAYKLSGRDEREVHRGRSEAPTRGQRSEVSGWKRRLSLVPGARPDPGRSALDRGVD